MVATSRSNSIGLVSNSLHPAASAFSRSPASACAERAIMGMSRPVCSRLLVEFAQWQAVALGRRTARDCACRALLLHDKGRPFRAAFIGGPDSAQPCTRSALLSEAVSASDCVSLQ